jgi:hypothetical protein
MTQKRSSRSKLLVLSIMAILTLGVILSGNWSNKSSAFAAPPQSFSNNDRVNQVACSNKSLRGTYGFSAQGNTLKDSPVPAALQGPFASSGFATFDGQGNFTLTATSSFNGIIQGPTTVTGSYRVNADCTYDSKADNGATFRAVIVNGGKELLIMQTTPGVAITGTAIKL